MKASRGYGICGWILPGVLLLALLPAAALAQWTHSGNATVGGKLGVGTQTPARGIHLTGSDAVFRMDRDRYSSAFMLVRTATGDFNTVWKSFSIGVSASGVNDGVFTIADKDTSAGGPGPTRFAIDNYGRVEIGGEADPWAGLHVRNPWSGSILRLDNSDGDNVFRVANDGDLYAMGDTLELRITAVTPGGYNLRGNNTLLANTWGGTARESFLALADGEAVIASSGSYALLKILDTSNYWTNYAFYNNQFALDHIGDIYIQAENQGEAQELRLQTTGEEIQFMADIDNDTAQDRAFSWMNNGTTSSHKIMDLAASGLLQIKSTLTQNHSFDLAEAYWKSEAGIEAGDVVCIDPAWPNAVVLARTAGDRAVVGVVSTDPGIVMGGGAFTAGQLEEVWGKEIAARYAADRERIKTELTEGNDYIQGRVAEVDRLKSTTAKAGNTAEADQQAEQLQQEEQQLADVLEETALRAFCRDNLAHVALAGRVPVKVDASYGAIGIGDALVASATPGHAMRADRPEPCTMVGKALETFAAGRGTIMMMVLNR